jgi:hypothetical protein
MISYECLPVAVHCRDGQMNSALGTVGINYIKLQRDDLAPDCADHRAAERAQRRVADADEVLGGELRVV